VNLGRHLTDVYPLEVLDDLPSPEPYQFCEYCEEAVTPIHGVCPWCDRLINDKTWRRHVLARALVDPQLVLDAAFTYQQMGKTFDEVAKHFAPRAGLAQNTLLRVLRDEFYVRDVEIKFQKSRYCPQVLR
jgi:hypothetical protein